MDRQGDHLGRLGRQGYGRSREGDLILVCELGQQLLPDQVLEIHPGARPPGQQRLGARHGGDAPLQVASELFDRGAIAPRDDRTHHGQDVADPVLQFRQQDALPLLAAAPLGGVLADLHVAAKDPVWAAQSHVLPFDEHPASIFAAAPPRLGG